MSPPAGLGALPLLLILAFPLCCCHLRSLAGEPTRPAEAAAEADCCDPPAGDRDAPGSDPDCRCSDRVRAPTGAETLALPAAVPGTVPQSRPVRARVDGVAPAATAWQAPPPTLLEQSCALLV